MKRHLVHYVDYYMLNTEGGDSRPIVSDLIDCFSPEGAYLGSRTLLLLCVLRSIAGHGRGAIVGMPETSKLEVPPFTG